MVAERKHGHIGDVGRCFLYQSSLSLKFWADAYSSAIFVINRLTSVTTGNKSPYQLLFKRLPDYSILRTFGCSCFPIIPSTQRTKLQSVTTRCIFIGYSSNHKGYKCKDLLSGRISVSRHVVFDEKSFPFGENIATTDQDRSQSTHFRHLTPTLFPTPSRHYSIVSENISLQEEDPMQSSLAANSQTYDQRMTTTEDRLQSTRDSNDGTTSRLPQGQLLEQNHIGQGDATRKSSRIGRPSVWMKDYDLTKGTAGQRQNFNLSATVVTRPNSNAIEAVGFPKLKLIGSLDNKDANSQPDPSNIGGLPKLRSLKSEGPNNLPKYTQDISSYKLNSTQIEQIGLQNQTKGKTKSDPHSRPAIRSTHTAPVCHSATFDQKEPNSVKQALADPSWTTVMNKEIKALELNKTWRLERRQQWMNVVGSRWVYRIKQNSDGSLERYKARLVAKGFHQKHGEDYDLTYSPVVKAAIIRTILTISTSRQ